MMWVKLGTHIADHERFLAAGAVARDLYVWGLTYSGKHELDGEIPMVAVLTSSWGAGTKANVKVATKLVEVGLWLRTNTGFSICRWAEQGNQTKAQITADREATRTRVRKLRQDRSENVRAYGDSTTTDVPTSTSYSLSESGSEIKIREGSSPEWWAVACDVVESTTGAKLERGAAWLRYSGHRRTNGKPMGQQDAQYWLATVDVREAAADRRRDQAMQDNANANRNRRFEGPPKPAPLTAEQQRRFAAEFEQRLMAKKAAGQL